MLYFEVVYQTAIAFGTILLLTIILGKQQIAQMTYFEYINGITFGSMAASLAVDLDQKTWQHFIALVLFGLFTLGMSFLSVKSRRARKLLEGDPVIVIADGKIMEENLRKSRFNIGQIMQLLRQKDIFDVSKVQFAILENDGQLSVMPKPDYQPVTHKNMFQKEEPPMIPMELVVDGQIIYENLRRLERSGKWLLEEVRKQKPFHSVRDLFYVAMESDGQLYVDLREDREGKPTAD